MSGAAPLPTEPARRVEDAFGPMLCNFYGATETGLVTLALPGEHTARPGTIGRLIGGNEVRLLDDDGRDVPVGEVGELYVRNAMLMDGYHGNDEATRTRRATASSPSAISATATPTATTTWPTARHDMVISGGVNIYPREIEQRLHEHPAVHEAAVIGVPDPEWGESLAAFVVLARRPDGDGRRARAHVSRRRSPTTSGRASFVRSSTRCRANRPARCSSASSSSGCRRRRRRRA